MKPEEYLIIDILKASLKGGKYIKNKNKDVDWEKLKNEADDHDITSLVYYTLDRSTTKNINEDILSKWRHHVCQFNICQIRQINIIQIYLSELTKLGIDIILLKGMYIRGIYPRPELRTMGDVDILIKKEDIETVTNFFIIKGYSVQDTHPVHLVFSLRGNIAIEVHWKLINEEYFNGNILDFEQNIWSNTIILDKDNIYLKRLGTDDFLLHLYLHMTVHAKYSGFGLRQLYDLALYIRNNNEYLNWNKILQRAENYGILKFTEALIVLVEKVFEFKIIDAKVNPMKYDIKDKDTVKLLNWILSSGVNGRKESVEGFGLLASYEEGSNKSKLRKSIQIIFPSSSKLTDRYMYAKKNTILLPIAWIHHILYGIFIKRYGIINSLRFTKKSLDFGEKRDQLIKTFEL